MGSLWSREAFDNPLRPQRPPVSGNEGLQSLSFAERIDNYRGQVEDSPINAKAREGQMQLPAVHSVRRFVPIADPAQPWPSGQVIWMDPTADGGLPHTRPPNFICIPQNFPTADLPKTILHERVHVSQRLHSEAWERLFGEVWNMKPWHGTIPSEIESRRRLNPDILNIPLQIWKDEWVPLALQKSIEKPRLDEIDLVWWNAKSKTLLRSPPAGWTEFFGNIPAGEHPFELVAQLVAENPSQNAAQNVIKPRFKTLPTSEVIGSS